MIFLFDKKYTFIVNFIFGASIITILLCACCLLNTDDNNIFVNLKCLTILNVIQSFVMILFCMVNGHIKRRWAYFTFTLSYALFLQWGYIWGIIDDNFWGKYIFSNISNISYDNETKGLFVILLAQAVTFFAYLLRESVQHEKNVYTINIGSSVRSIRHWCRLFMICGGIAAFAKLCLKILFIMQNGYLATYLADGNELYQNVILDLFDRFYYVGFYGFLATFPNVRAVRFPIFVFLLYSCLTLFTGVRGEFVINVFFVSWYLIKRDMCCSEKNISFTKTKIVVFAIIAVVSVAFLFEYGYARVDKESGMNLGEKVLAFIQTQGRSGHLVSLSLQNYDEMCKYIQPSMMVLYPVRNFILNNSFVRLFSNVNLGQTLANLKRNSDFGNILTYITNPVAYLQGAGIGTSYLAEIVNAYGLCGIIIFSLLLGWTFFQLDHIRPNRWAFNLLLMNAYGILVYIPRHATLSIIPASVLFVLFILFIKILILITKVCHTEHEDDK